MKTHFVHKHSAADGSSSSEDIGKNFSNRSSRLGTIRNLALLTFV